MLPTLIVAVALSIPTPVTAPGTTGAGTLDARPAATSDVGVRWLSPSVATLDGALIRITADRPAIVGQSVIDPAEGDAPAGPGATGVVVRRIQDRLRELNVYRGATDGIYGRETAASVVAFHKLIGTKRTNRWTVDDWHVEPVIDNGAILARHASQADRVEVDIARQLLFVVRANDVAAIVPVSTGNGEIYWSQNSGNVRATTPRGNFRLFRHISGWRVNYLGGLYKPWYFTPYYAIHGSRSVPAHPASHGCVRIPTWESNHLDDYLKIGMPVHIWDA
jgi:lipoprotein-anchoring transpeptidase ErfK/SrfK